MRFAASVTKQESNPKRPISEILILILSNPSSRSKHTNHAHSGHQIAAPQGPSFCSHRRPEQEKSHIRFHPIRSSGSRYAPCAKRSEEAEFHCPTEPLLHALSSSSLVNVTKAKARHYVHTKDRINSPHFFPSCAQEMNHWAGAARRPCSTNLTGVTHRPSAKRGWPRDQSPFITQLVLR